MCRLSYFESRPLCFALIVFEERKMQNKYNSSQFIAEEICSWLSVSVLSRLTYASVNHRRQSFSCRRRTRVERSAAARNIRILSVYFSQTSEDSAVPALLPLTVCVVPEQ